MSSDCSNFKPGKKKKKDKYSAFDRRLHSLPDKGIQCNVTMTRHVLRVCKGHDCPVTCLNISQYELQFLTIQYSISQVTEESYMFSSLSCPNMVLSKGVLKLLQNFGDTTKENQYISGNMLSHKVWSVVKF